MKKNESRVGNGKLFGMRPEVTYFDRREVSPAEIPNFFGSYLFWIFFLKRSKSETFCLRPKVVYFSSSKGRHANIRKLFCGKSGEVWGEVARRSWVGKLGNFLFREIGGTSRDFVRGI